MSKQSARSKIIPLGDRVLVKPFTEEELRQNQGSKAMKFILPESMTKEKSAQGKVLAVGEGQLVEGVLIRPRVNVGDVVLFSKYSYDEVEHGGEVLYLMREENLLAVIK